MFDVKKINIDSSNDNKLNIIYDDERDTRYNDFVYN